MAKERAVSVLDELKKAMTGADSRRSKLDRWMMSNYAAFEELLTEYGTDWPKLTEVFDALGFSEDGRPLGKETVRQTWYRVRQRKGRRGAGKNPLLSAGTVSVKEIDPSGTPSQAPAPATKAPGSGMSSQEALEAMKAEMNRRSGRM